MGFTHQPAPTHLQHPYEKRPKISKKTLRQLHALFSHLFLEATPSTFFAKRRWNPRTHPSIPILIMCVDSNYVVDRPVSRFAASGLQAGKKGPSREIEMGAAPSSSSLIPDASAARATGARCSHTAPTHTPPARACPSGGCQMVCVLVPAWQPVPFCHWLTPVLCVRRRNCRCLW